MKNDIRQIRIGKHDFGITGLTGAMETVVAAHKGSADDIISEALYQILKKDNYIPGNAKDAYKQAFLREYQKLLGLSVSNAEIEDALTVTVVGAGCSRCENLEMELMMVLSELDLPARINHVRDPKEIGRMGILGLPEVLINDEIKCAGVVPPKSQLIKWFTQYKK